MKMYVFSLTIFRGRIQSESCFCIDPDAPYLWKIHFVMRGNTYTWNRIEKWSFEIQVFETFWNYAFFYYFFISKNVESIDSEIVYSKIRMNEDGVLPLDRIVVLVAYPKDSWRAIHRTWIHRRRIDPSTTFAEWYLSGTTVHMPSTELHTICGAI